MLTKQLCCAQYSKALDIMTSLVKAINTVGRRSMSVLHHLCRCQTWNEN